MKPKAPIMSPQLFISLALLTIFSVAYFLDPKDEMMKGALLGYVAAGVQFFLGSSTGSKTNGDVVRQKALQGTATATGDKPTINVDSDRDEGELPAEDRVRL